MSFELYYIEYDVPYKLTELLAKVSILRYCSHQRLKQFILSLQHMIISKCQQIHRTSISLITMSNPFLFIVADPFKRIPKQGLKAG